MPEGGSSIPLWPRWAVVAGLATLLLAASLVPVGSNTPWAAGSRGPPLFVLGHLLGYAAFAGTLAHALSTEPGSQAEVGGHRAQNSSTAHHAQYSHTAQLLAVAFLVTVASSVGIEGLQELVATRSFSYDDIAVNALGAALGVAGRELVGRVIALARVDR